MYHMSEDNQSKQNSVNYFGKKDYFLKQKKIINKNNKTN